MLIIGIAAIHIERSQNTFMRYVASIRRALPLAAAALAGSLVFHAMNAAAPPTPKPLSSFDPEVKELLAKMTLDEKIGQMTQPDFSAVRDLTDIENLSLGSLLSG